MDDLQKEVYEAAVSDDRKKLASALEKDKSLLSVCFGRFPLLSVCYLFGSKRILARYEHRMLSVAVYTYADEPNRIFTEFAKAAGRSLRLFSSSEVITPQEVLAVLGESGRLLKIYPETKGSADKIDSVYSLIHGRSAKQADNGALVLGKYRFSRKQIIVFTVLSVIAVLAVILSSAFLIVSSVSYGNGITSPYKIQNYTQLSTALGRKTGKYKLSQDILYEEGLSAIDFEGNIDGGGFTLYAGNAGKSIFGSFSGTLKNLNIVFEPSSLDLISSSALLAITNSGAISNVNVKAKVSITEKSSDEDCYFSVFAVENNGKIENCTLNAEIDMTGDAAGNAYVSGICALNNGTVSSCAVSAESYFKTDTVDIGGITAENREGAVISDCTNNAEISQMTENGQWSPNSAGVTMINAGTVADSFNNGKVSAVSAFYESGAESLPQVIAAGIVASNRGTVTKCKSNADVSAVAEMLPVYAGGIAAIQDDLNNASIINCGSSGSITVKSPQIASNLALFAGGIVGYNIGYVSGSFSSCSFIKDEASPNIEAGGLMGRSCVEVGLSGGGLVITKFYWDTLYYLGQANIIWGVASVLFQFEGETYLNNGNNYNLNAVRTQEQLEDTEVYW